MLLNQLSIQKLFAKFDLFYVFLLLLFVVFVVFPTNNHLTDSYDYAASVKYGVKLFAPHHLLYNAVCYVFVRIFSPFVADLDVIRTMQYINAVFAILSGFVFRKILILNSNKKSTANAWTLFALCSFGFMRFATEAETFIIPIYFSLIATWYFLKFLTENTNRYALYSGIFASIACLFHQIHLFWGIGLFVGFMLAKQYKSGLYYLMFTPTVLIVYVLVVYFYNDTELSVTTFFNFIAYYYHSDNADTSFTINNLIITGITFVRTFFQVHGLVAVLFDKYLWLALLVSAATLVLLAFSISHFIKKFRFTRLFKSNVFAQTVAIVFVLQLVFAVFSHGNSEFMVMFPFLLALFLPSIIEIGKSSIWYFTGAMFVWNMSFGLIPNKCIDFQNNGELIHFIHRHPTAYFVVKEYHLLTSMYFYEFGVDVYDKLLPIDHDFKSNKLLTSSTIYTDVLTKKTAMGRLEFTKDFDTSGFVFKQHHTYIHTFMGGFYVDEITLKK